MYIKGGIRMNQELHGEYAIEHSGTKVGQLTVSAAGIRTSFQAQCVMATGEVLRLTLLVGEQYIPLGVMLPNRDKLLFEKRYSRLELQTKGVTAIHGVRLMAAGQTPPPPKPTVEDTVPSTPAPAPEPAVETLVSIPEPAIETLAPAPEPEPIIEPSDHHWESVRILPDNRAIYTHEARIAASPLPVADEDLDDINPYPTAQAVPASIPNWIPCSDPAALFTDPHLTAAGNRIREAMTRPQVDHIELAVPFDTGEPFPLMPIFCLGEVTDIGGRAHLVFQIKDGEIIK